MWRRAFSRENTPKDNIVVTGNTVIDALFVILDQIKGDKALQAKLDAAMPAIDPSKKLILVTGHRRENFGGGFENICQALKALAERGDTQIIYPMHLNPNVREPVDRILTGVDNVHLIEPLTYLPFVRLMSQAHLRTPWSCYGRHG